MADSADNALVSIVIPSFNQGKFIRETIQSCLDQDYRPIEIIVQDGGSTDETLAILKSFSEPELSWTSEPDSGVVDAVNKALALARGTVLTIQSSDDVFLPGSVSAALKVFSQHPEAGLVYGDVNLINSESEIIGQDIQGQFDLADYLGRLIYIPQPGTFFTNSALKICKGWKEEFSYAADAHFWMRVAVKFPVIKLNRRVAAYRYHSNQRDTQSALIARDWGAAVTDILASEQLNFKQRRFVRMGIHLANFRYANESAWRKRTIELYKAFLSNPLAVFDTRFPKKELLPGRVPIWAFLSRMKRMLGLPARSG